MWNLRFAAEEYYYGKEPNPYFKERLQLLKPGKLLMPAEGEGRNAVFAATLGWQVKAVDFSEEGKKKALKLAKEFKVDIDYQIADIIHSEFGKEIYDAIGLIYFHILPQDRFTVHQKLLHSLKPGGHVILEAFNKNQIRNSSGGPKSPEMLYNIKLMQDDFAELEIIELKEMSHHLVAGNGHAGEADVIRLFGRKKLS